MKKKIIVVFVVIAVVVIALICALAYFKFAKPESKSVMQTSDAVQTSMPDAIGNTNPFKTNVNPVSGYQNPFEK